MNMEHIKSDFLSNKNYFYTSVIITFLVLLPQIILIYSVKNFFNVFLLFILLVALSKFSKLLFIIFALYFNLFNIFLLHIKMHWGGNTSAGYLTQKLELARISPKYETLEYLQAYIDYRDYLILGYAIFILILLYRFIMNHKQNYMILKKLGIVVAILAFLIVQSKGPLSIIKEFFQQSDRVQLIEKRNNYLSSINHTDIQLSKQNIYDKVIIIQGESANKHHMNIYGYSQKTTPYLSQLLESKKLYKFNAISPGNQTVYSVPCTFTMANVLDWKSNYIHSQSILADFQDYGYKTYWISSQAIAGSVDSYVANIAFEANQQIFFNQGDATNAKTDIAIIDFLTDKKHSQAKEMYVFHLLGSHFSYKDRYPISNSLFNKPKSILEAYDNSIYFTDYIIERIIKYFSKNNQKILVVYISDHGEVVGVANDLRHGHGFLSPYKDEFDVPFVVYSNIENKRIDEFTSKNNRYFNLENLNYYIKYISGISNDLNISYSSKIFTGTPNNIKDYGNLNFFQRKKKENTDNNGWWVKLKK